MKRMFGALVVIVATCILPQHCFSQSPAVTPEIKKQTIEELSVLVRDRYAYKEIGLKLQQLLQKNLAAGEYDSYSRAEEFSYAVTNDLRSLNSDRHLALNFSPQAPAATQNTSTPPPPLTPEERARQVSAFNRQMNFGFKGVQFLNGNIGYLKFDYFDSYLDYSTPVLDGAIAFLKHCDAIIFDLRYNGGGSPQMVGYIAGFFFKERTLVGISYDRLSDTTTEMFIDPQPPEKQLAGVNLYVLTSSATVSAAEGLAYDLKYLKNAKIIGETSAGAANPGRLTRINNLFTAFIPNRHGMNVVTGKNWEGTGVPVDVPCPAEDALRVARIEALKQLQQKATDAFQKTRLNSYITYLETAATQGGPSKQILRQYHGEYEGGRSVTLREGKLYYTRPAESGGQLHWIAPDLFMHSEGDTTIKFKRNKQNRVIGLETRWSLSSNSNSAARIKY